MTKRELLAALANLSDDAVIYIGVINGGMAEIITADICDIEDGSPSFGCLVTDIEAIGL